MSDHRSPNRRRGTSFNEKPAPGSKGGAAVDTLTTDKTAARNSRSGSGTDTNELEDKEQGGANTGRSTRKPRDNT